MAEPGAEPGNNYPGAPKAKDNKGDDAVNTKTGFPIPSSYLGDVSIGATAIPTAWPTGATGLRIKVTHATQNIRVGQGATAIDADANAALATPIDIGDGIVDIGRSGSGSLFHSLLGSGSATTANTTVLG